MLTVILLLVWAAVVGLIWDRLHVWQSRGRETLPRRLSPVQPMDWRRPC